MIGIVLGADKLLFLALQTADHLASLLALLGAAPVARAGLKFNSLGSSERFLRSNMDPFIDPVPLESLNSGEGESRTWDTTGTRLASLSEASVSHPMPALVDESCASSRSSGASLGGEVADVVQVFFFHISM
jgi:hypothetical protein